MDNYAEFEQFLVYDDNGNIIGLTKTAPDYAKIAYRKWYDEQQDLERLKELFQNKQ